MASIYESELLSRRTVLKRTAGTAAGLYVAHKLGISIDITPAEASQPCPPLPTDGRPAPFCVVPDNTDLRAASKFSRYYFIDNDGTPRYTAGDTDVMGVPNAQLLIESLEHIGSSDFLHLDLSSRTIENIGGVEKVSYFDRQSKQRRYIGRWDVMRVPADGGVGIALASNSSDTLNWKLFQGQRADKVWGPILTEAKVNRHVCNNSRDCGWNCVQWVVISRLKAGANVTGLKTVGNDLIHRDLSNGSISSIVDYVYFWDLNQGEKVLVDHSYINTPVKEGDNIWQAEKLQFKPVVRPSRIVPYNNN